MSSAGTYTYEKVNGEEREKLLVGGKIRNENYARERKKKVGKDADEGEQKKKIRL